MSILKLSAKVQAMDRDKKMATAILSGGVVLATSPTLISSMYTGKANRAIEANRLAMKASVLKQRDVWRTAHEAHKSAFDRLNELIRKHKGGVPQARLDLNAMADISKKERGVYSNMFSLFKGKAYESAGDNFLAKAVKMEKLQPKFLAAATIGGLGAYLLSRRKK